MTNSGVSMQVGELVGRGRTSDVYAFGADSVIKMPHDDVAADWPQFEAALTQAVHALGVPAPRVLDVVDVDGRDAVVFERVDGPSMWQQMLDGPAHAPALARELASIQKSLFAVGIPPGLPELVDRLSRKIQIASGLTTGDRAEAIQRTEDLPRGAALLHGDLHPGNVLMGANGPIVIDWFDATIGHPVADVVRSSILLHAAPLEEPRHLPGASAELLRTIRHAYLDVFRPELAMAKNDLASWQAVLAAARLAEDAEVHQDGLIALWQARDDAAAATELLLV